MSTSIQKDLFGNVASKIEEERVNLYATEYARDLFRKIKATTPREMLDAIEDAAKILVTLTDIVDQDDFKKIRVSKDKEEIASILRNSLNSLNQYIK